MMIMITLFTYPSETLKF